VIFATFNGESLSVIGRDGTVKLFPENQKITAPERLYDIACGNGFALACNVAGDCYGLEKIARGDLNTLVAIPELSKIRVERVFASAAHAMVLSRDGQVWAWGSGEFGRLGLGGDGSHAKFAQVQRLPEIVDVALGDTFSLFLTKSGEIYGTGFGPDGIFLDGKSTRTNMPIRAPTADRFVAIAAGSQHALFVTGLAQFVHPAMRLFPYHRQLIVDAAVNHQRGRILSRILLSTFHQKGTCPGDAVTVNGREGFLIGKVGSKFLVGFPNGREIVSSITFTTRQGLVVVNAGGDSWYDGGDLLERFYGLKTGQFVDRGTGVQKVLGVSGPVLGLSSATGEVAQWDHEPLPSFYRSATLHDCAGQRIDGMAVGGVSYPITRVDPFWILGSPPVEVVGSFGEFYVGVPLFGEPAFYSKAKAQPLESNGRLAAHDRARYNDQRGTVVAVSGDSALFLSDDAQLEPVATLARPHEVEVAGQKFQVHMKSATRATSSSGRTGYRGGLRRRRRGRAGPLRHGAAPEADGAPLQLGRAAPALRPARWPAAGLCALYAAMLRK
jgi:hypothetical protein